MQNLDLGRRSHKLYSRSALEKGRLSHGATITSHFVEFALWHSVAQTLSLQRPDLTGRGSRRIFDLAG